MKFHRRYIMHIDINAAFASIEEGRYPFLRNFPLAVVGNPEERHGIVMAKNAIAKRFGVATADVIWQAEQKCPGLQEVPSRHWLYELYRAHLYGILLQHSNLMEGASIDEAYLDVTCADMTWVKAREIGDTIRRQVWDELGITVSVGISWNKVFAKIASEIKKPNGTTVVTPLNFREKIWPLPVSDMIMIGPSRTKTLTRRNVHTIGDLAQVAPESIFHWLKSVGIMLRIYARGEDKAPVKPVHVIIPPKSIGHSSTLRKDIADEESLRCGVTILAEAVADRMRDQGVKGCTLHVYFRRASDLMGVGCQRKLPYPSCIAREIVEMVMSIFHDNHYALHMPFRGLGISISNLIDLDTPVQMDMFGDQSNRMKMERLERTIHAIKAEYGAKSIELGICHFTDWGKHMKVKEDHQYRTFAMYSYQGEEAPEWHAYSSRRTS